MRLRADNASNRKQASEPHQPRSRTPAKGERCPFGGPAPSEAPGSGDGPGLHRPPGYRGRPGRGSGRSALAGRRDGRGEGCPRRPARPCPAAALPQPPRPRRPPPRSPCSGRRRGAAEGERSAGRCADGAGGLAEAAPRLGPAAWGRLTRQPPRDPDLPAPGGGGGPGRCRAAPGSRPPRRPSLPRPAPPPPRLLAWSEAVPLLVYFSPPGREGICGASRRSKLFWTLVTQKASLQLIPLQ